MHYYQFNIADYRKDTQHLTPIEHYIYRELIDWYYLDEKPIPKKTQLVLRRLRLGSENNQALANILEEFFYEDEKGWVHGRINAEIDKYKAKADIARANGSKGGRPKKTQSVNLANPEITGSKANQEPITINHKPLTKDQKKENRTKKRFVPPPYEEVLSHCNDPTQTERFINHYESNGWKVGRNKMVNWKACLTNWMKRQEEYKSGNNKPTYKTNYEQLEENLTESEQYLRSLQQH